MTIYANAAVLAQMKAAMEHGLLRFENRDGVLYVGEHEIVLDDHHAKERYDEMLALVKPWKP